MVDHRIQVKDSDYQQLPDHYDTPSRCLICGYPLTQEEIDNEADGVCTRCEEKNAA